MVLRSPARLHTLTLESFVAAKTAAWVDRHAARDLYNLWALAEHGAISLAAAAFYRAIGPTGEAPGAWAFTEPPDAATWTAALAHQCVLAVDLTRQPRGLRAPGAMCADFCERPVRARMSP